MDRRPLWPIAVGVALWIGASVLAWQDMWWPLIIVAVISIGPGLVMGGMLLFTRRAKRRAIAIANREQPAPAGPIAEPPVVRASGPRTNAKTAGRKRGRGAASVLLLVGVVAAEGCEKIERARSERRARETADDGGVESAEPPTTTPTTTTTTTSTSTSTTATTNVALDAALARAITPPVPGGDATWRVDPFVAALVFEMVRSGESPTFTKLDAPIPEGPQVGFRAGEIADGSLLHRLGLRTGDVIEAIGGVLLSDASRIGFALDGAENSVDVTVFRDGISSVHSYRLTQALAWTGLLAGFTGEPSAAAPVDVVATNEVPSDVPTTPGDVRPPGSGGATPTTPSSGGGGGGGGSKPTPPSGGGGSGGGSSGGGGSKPTPGSASDPVRCETANKCTITKAYFDKMVASPSAMQSQATIVPAIQNDVHSGYKLKTVKAGSSLSKLGFRAGDKITHVNGKDLTDEMQAASLYFGLSGTSVFKIRFERGGQSQVKTVVVD